jgi:hypothetical protein
LLNKALSHILKPIKGRIMIKKIISGGQTGADQVALDAALKYNFPHGGWVPKDRKNGVKSAFDPF